MITKLNQKQILFLINAGLVLATIIAYEPVRHNDFVKFDDMDYVTENPHVTGGLTHQSVIWAFTKSYAANWHPMTWLSHMADCQLYGLKPLGHHITSLLIHIANSLLLFWLLQKMTGATWKSAFVSAAFALHPIHVESVAWISERKDVLSALFWMLTIVAYLHYVRKPGLGRYMLVLLAFIAGLMSKPMVVTLPFVLVLLDYWPLNRFPISNFQFPILNRQLAIENRQSVAQFSILNSLYEKIPLFVLSATSCVITYTAHKHAQAIVSPSVMPLFVRIINAIGCYFSYAVKIIYPKGLALLYPLPDKVSTDTAALAIMGLVLMLYFYVRGRPWLVVGLLWYIGTFVPVIGLVQVGRQLMADRYTYLPSIGLFIIIVWSIEEIITKYRFPKVIAIISAAAIIITMTLLTRIQTGYWQNSEKLFTRAISVTTNNYVMHDAYGLYLCGCGRLAEGVKHFQEAVRINPGYAAGRINLCQGLMELGRTDEAINCYLESLKVVFSYEKKCKLYTGLGFAYEKKGDLDIAILNYKKALELAPDYAPALQGFASALQKKGESYKPPKNNNFKF
jgi:tetratricopeptide (TPR) repeat protein